MLGNQSTDQSVVQNYHLRYQNAYYAWNPFYPQAATDLRFYNGDQYSEKDRQKLYEEGRSALVCNIVRPKITWIAGYQKTHRTSPICMPVEGSDQQACDDWTEVLNYVLQHGDGYKVQSDCFLGGLTSGWNLETIWLDYRDDPVNGDIKFGRVPYSGFITDPYFTNLDFSDCGFVIMRKYLPVQVAASLLPGMEKEVFELQKYGWSRDDKFTWLPYQIQPNGTELIAYNEFYTQHWETERILVDMRRGQWTEWKGTKDQLQMYRDLFPDEDLEVTSRKKRYIMKHIICNETAMKSEKNPYGLDEYPFTPYIYHWCPEAESWEHKVQSAVRFMRGPQYEANIMRLQMLDILQSQTNSGWIAEQDAVINPRSLFQTSQGKVIWAKKGQMAAIQRLEAAQIPQSSFELTSLFDGDINTTIGMNDAMGGIIESGNESGLMMQIKQGAALTGMQEPFDNLRQSQKVTARKLIKIIQGWTPEKIERILGRRPTEQFYTKDFVKFDVVIGEGLHTDTQKQMYFRQLLDLKQITESPTMPSPITPDMLVQAAPIQGKSQLTREMMARQQQQMQQAQAQQEQQMAVVETQRQINESIMLKNRAQAQEAYTRAVANMGLEDERNSKAVENRSQAALDKAKALAELEKMDDDRIVKYLETILKLEEMNARKEQQLKMEDVKISSLGGQPSMNQSPQGGF